MTIKCLDLSELGTIDNPGFGLQSLISDIGYKLQFKVELGGRGADEGRDVFLIKDVPIVRGLSMPLKILVNCKDTSKSGKQLSLDDLGNWLTRVSQHGCNAFLLVTTMPVTDDVVRAIRDAAANHRFQSAIWQPTDLIGLLLDGQSDVFRLTIARFFPKNFRDDPSVRAASYFLESLPLLDKGAALQLALKAIRECGDNAVAWSIFEALGRREDVRFDFDLREHYLALVSLKDEAVVSTATGWLYGVLEEGSEHIFGESLLSVLTKDYPHVDGSFIDFQMRFSSADATSIVFDVEGVGHGGVGKDPEHLETKEFIFTSKLVWNNAGINPDCLSIKE